MSVYTLGVISALQEWLNDHWNNKISQEEGDLLVESFEKALDNYGKHCNAGVYACMQVTLMRIAKIVKEDVGSLSRDLPDEIDYLNGVLERMFGEHAHKVIIPQKDSFVRIFEDVKHSRIMRNKVSGLIASELRDMLDEFIIRVGDLPIITFNDMDRCITPARHFSVKSEKLDGKDCAIIDILGYREQ